MEKRTLMTERERLIELIYEYTENITARELHEAEFDEKFADYLLNNNVIVPPCKVVWYIENRCTEYQCVTGVSIENLPLHIVRNLDKYRYYATKEEAEKALKGA